MKKRIFTLLMWLITALAATLPLAAAPIYQDNDTGLIFPGKIGEWKGVPRDGENPGADYFYRDGAVQLQIIIVKPAALGMKPDEIPNGVSGATEKTAVEILKHYRENESAKIWHNVRITFAGRKKLEALKLPCVQMDSSYSEQKKFIHAGKEKIQWVSWSRRLYFAGYSGAILMLQFEWQHTKEANPADYEKAIAGFLNSLQDILPKQ